MSEPGVQRPLSVSSSAPPSLIQGSGSGGEPHQTRRCAAASRGRVLKKKNLQRPIETREFGDPAVGRLGWDWSGGQLTFVGDSTYTISLPSGSHQLVHPFTLFQFHHSDHANPALLTPSWNRFSFFFFSKTPAHCLSFSRNSSTTIPTALHPLIHTESLLTPINQPL